MYVSLSDEIIAYLIMELILYSSILMQDSVNLQGMNSISVQTKIYFLVVS
jgi:hypothetical protein